MNKKVSIGALITLMLVAAMVTFSMTCVFAWERYNETMNNLQAREAMYDKLSEVDKNFRSDYVGAVDEAALRDALCAGYLRGSGDPYARYYTAEAYQREEQKREGRIAGVGVVTDRDTSGYLVITAVYADSAAESAGLQVGDLILEIDGTEVKPENTAQMQQLLQGDAGTKVNLVVRHGADDTSMDLTRRYVDVPSVYSSMLDGNIGYLKVTNLTKTTGDQFVRQMEKQISDGAVAFVLDLRNNTGGVEEAALKILDRMLPAMRVATATYQESGKVEYLETTDSKELNRPLVILTNERTACEAELIAQVMKDLGRAKTVGTKTLGKGTKQEAAKLTDGSVIWFSMAVYQTTESETFNLVGVKPDYEVKLSAEEEKNFDTLTAQTDPQILKGMEVLQSLIRANSESNSSSSQPAEE